jgi:hypothetical protein
MRFRILITMIASVCLAVCGLANAVPITHNDYTLNTDTNIVSHTDGTEWLQWDVTNGDSISGALDEYEKDGWALAGYAQMSKLFGDFGWTAGTDPTGRYRVNGDYVSSTDESSYDQFLELFGVSNTDAGGSFGYGFDSFINVEARFGDEQGTTSYFSYATVRSDYRFISSNNEYPTGAMAAYYSTPGMARDDIDPYSIQGVALVRTATVTEPTSLAIFALGTFGLALRRFKKQS